MRQAVQVFLMGLTLMSFLYNDSGEFVGSWNHFKRALKEADIQQSASFFNFPISQEDNDLWLLATRFNNKADSLLGGGPKEFTRTDFENYYDGIFPKPLRSFIQQVNASVLLKTRILKLEPLQELDTTHLFKIELSLNNNEIYMHYEHKFPVHGDTISQLVLYTMVVNPEERLKFSAIQIAN